MEISLAKWLSELEMEEPEYQYQMNPYDYTLDELSFPSSFFAESNANELDHNRASEVHASFFQTTPYSVVERPPEEHIKTPNSWKSCSDGQLAYITSASSSSQFISFGDSNSCRADSEKFDDGVNCGAAIGVDGDQDFSFLISQSSGEDQNYYLSGYGGHEIKKAETCNRSLVHAREHVIAERKRREKLSQRFVALSSLIPGLKKTDKASVLGGAIKYVKELQGRMKWAEEERAAKRVIKSVVFVKKTNLSSDNFEDETSSSDENRDRVSVRPVPNIETRVSDKDVLVRIHCQKGKGCLSNILSQIEKLNLSVVNSCVLPFGHSRLDITIVAQMDVDFCMTATDLGTKLREALVEFI